MDKKTKQQLYNQKDYPFFNAAILKFIGSKQKILDVGCWDGKMGSTIKRKGNEVWGIDIANKALKIAQKRLDRVFCLDIESDNLEKLPKEYFDVIILSDVLEHLFDPKAILEKFKKFLTKDGRIIISLPNVAFWEVRLNLLLGKFEYKDLHILDPTHLRFFTLQSAKDMFLKAGLSVIKVDYSRTGWRRFITNFWPTLLASQFVFVLQTDDWAKK